MHVFKDGAIDPCLLIGEGSLRSCYRVREKPLCLKFYRQPGTHYFWTKPSTRRHIWLARFIPWLNANWQEWHYHRELRRRLPSDLLAVFPETVELAYSPERGWGIVESLVVNADGTASRRILDEIPDISDPDVRRRVYEAAAALLSRLAEHAVRFFDPPNLLVQWDDAAAFRLRITDFEPNCKAAVPGLSLIRPYVRHKAIRRSARFLAQLRSLVFAAVPE